jgi:hypothetical protein
MNGKIRQGFKGLKLEWSPRKERERRPEERGRLLLILEILHFDGFIHDRLGRRCIEKKTTMERHWKGWVTISGGFSKFMQRCQVLYVRSERLLLRKANTTCDEGDNTI